MISSPDLGVDLGSSDPFSSLERAKGFIRESLGHGKLVKLLGN